jgi:hypothetical protein
MAKTEGVNFSDITEGLIKNNLQMSSFIKNQLEMKASTEKLQKENNDVAKKTYEILADNANRKKDSNVKKVDKEVERVNKSLTSKSGDGLNANIIKMVQSLKTVEKTFKLDTKGILEKNRARPEFGGQSKLSGMKEGLKDLFSVRGFLDKTGIAKRGAGGWLSNKLDAAEFAKGRAQARIATGERGTYAEGTIINGKNVGGQVMSAKESEKKFIQDEKKANQLRKKQGELERSIEKKYKKFGMTEEQISTTPEAKQLKNLTKEMVELDPRGMSEFTKLESSYKKDSKGKVIKPDVEEKEESEEKTKRAGKPKVLSGADEEYQIEQSKLQNDQLDLLTKIEENTRPGAVAGAEAGGGDGGGGMLGGLGKGLAALGGGLGKLGAGIGKGIKGIFVGLAEGITILGTAVMSGVGAVGLAALAGIILTIAAALRIAAPAIKEFAPVLMKLAEQIGIVAGVIGEVLIEGIKMLPEIISSIGDVIVGTVTAIADGVVKTIDAVTTSIERLAAIDGGNLLQVGAGLVAVAGGMAAFAAANVVAGISQVAGKLMSVVSGTKTPVDQLEQIAEFGPNLNQAGTGVKNLAAGMAAFSKVDSKTIEAIGKLPIEKIVAASGALRTTNAVSETSSDNKMKALPSTAQPSTNVVSAPTTITKQTKNIMMKQSIRNPEGTINSYIKSRYSTSH